MTNAATCSLTDRERTVFWELVRGKTNSEIAEELYLTQNTTREYIARLYSKMGVHRRSALIEKAVQMGLLEIVMKV